MTMDVVNHAEAWTAVADAWDVNVDEVDGHSAAATTALIETVGIEAGDRVLELAAGPPVGPGSIFSLSDPAALEVLATDAGIRDVSVRPIDITFRAASFDDHFARVTSMAGPLAGVLAAAPPDTLEAVRRTAAD